MCRKYLPPDDMIFRYEHLKPKDRERKLALEYARANYQIARYQMNTKNCDCWECRSERPGLLRRILG